MLDYLGLVMAQEFTRQQVDGTQPALVRIAGRKHGKAQAHGSRRRAAATLRRVADRLEPIGEVGGARR